MLTTPDVRKLCESLLDDGVDGRRPLHHRPSAYHLPQTTLGTIHVEPDAAPAHMPAGRPGGPGLREARPPWRTQWQTGRAAATGNLRMRRPSDAESPYKPKPESRKRQPESNDGSKGEQDEWGEA